MGRGIDWLDQGLIESATPEECERARQRLDAERTLIENERNMLGQLLAVAARHPVRVPVTVLAVPTGAPAPSGTGSTADPIATSADAWGMPVSDLRAALLALDGLSRVRR